MVKSSGAPRISVVIATHNREIRLVFALEALAAQSLSHREFEVVVVRSRDSRPPLAAAPDGLQARFVTAPGPPSRPAQRNLGWRAARGELVAFTDDDCRPSPGWLEALAAAADSSAFVQGRTEPDPDERHLLHGLARSIEVVGPSAWYPTCNIAYPRPLLERLDGFDEAFVASGEDTDLALRAQAAGAVRRYADDGLVWHAVLPQPLPRAMRAGWRRWHSTPLLVKRHPAQRDHLVARVFFSRSHAALAGLVAALALTRRPAAIGLAMLPFAIEGLDRGSLGPRGLLRQIAHLPARLLAEGAVAAGLLRGALRHRSPLF